MKFGDVVDTGKVQAKSSVSCPSLRTHEEPLKLTVLCTEVSSLEKASRAPVMWMEALLTTKFGNPRIGDEEETEMEIVPETE